MVLLPDLSQATAQHEPSAERPLLPERIDFTTLSTFLTCPRRGFFKHILGWTPEGPGNKHLIFGRAIHAGLEAMYKTIQAAQTSGVIVPTAELISATAEGFDTCWNSVPDMPSDDEMEPKTWSNGQELLKLYVKKHGEMDQKEIEVLTVETIGSIPLTFKYNDTPVVYITKIDLVGKTNEGRMLEVLEHKTASMFSEAILTGFSMSYQGEGYLTYLHSLSEDIKTRAVFNLLQLTKHKRDFYRHPISRKLNLSNRFIIEVSDWAEYIIHSMVGVEEWKETNKNYMDPNVFFPWFPRTPGTPCTTYMRKCEFADLCFSAPNPLMWQGPPPGYRVHHWDPELEGGQ